MRRLLPILTLAALLASSPLLSQPAPSDKARFDALERATEKAPADQRVAYNALLVAFTTFRDASIAHTPCPNSAGCAPAQRASFNANFLSMAEGSFATAPPNFTSDDLTRADADLNAAYDRLLTQLPASCEKSPCLSQDSFRDVQRDWIRYRDAWVTFAQLHWPQISSDSWRTLLTRQRLASINS